MAAPEHGAGGRVLRAHVEGSLLDEDDFVGDDVFVEVEGKGVVLVAGALDGDTSDAGGCSVPVESGVGRCGAAGAGLRPQVREVEQMALFVRGQGAPPAFDGLALSGGEVGAEGAGETRAAGRGFVGQASTAR